MHQLHVLISATKGRRSIAASRAAKPVPSMLSIWCWHCGISKKPANTTRSSQGMTILPGLVFIWLIEAATVVTWIRTSSASFFVTGQKTVPPVPHRTFPSAKKRSPERRASYSRPRTWIRKRSTFPSHHPRYWSSLQGKNSKTRFWGAHFWKIPHIGWCSRCASLQIQPWRCRALGKQTPSCYIPAANFSAAVSCQKLASNEQRAIVLESFHQEPYSLTVISEGNVGHRPPNWPKYWSPRSHWLWCLRVLKATWTSSCAIMKVSELCCHLLGVSVAIYINHFNEKIMMFTVYHWIMAKFSWFSGLMGKSWSYNVVTP